MSPLTKLRTRYGLSVTMRMALPPSMSVALKTCGASFLSAALISGLARRSKRMVMTLPLAVA